MAEMMFLGAFSILWLIVSAQLAFSRAWKMRNYDEKKEANDMIETASRLRAALDDIEDLVDSPLVAYIIMLIPTFLLLFDATGFAIALWKVDFSSIQHIIFITAVIANTLSYMILFRVMAKITEAVAQEEPPEYVENLVLEIYESRPYNSILSIVSKVSKAIVALDLFLTILGD